MSEFQHLEVRVYKTVCPECANEFFELVDLDALAECPYCDEYLSTDFSESVIQYRYLQLDVKKGKLELVEVLGHGDLSKKS